MSKKFLMRNTGHLVFPLNAHASAFSMPPYNHARLCAVKLRLLAPLALFAACATSIPPASEPLVFLTRGDCVNTATMRANLDEALKEMGRPLDYRFIELESLPASDARTGYPTPTILKSGRDLFGMTTPTPPFPDPT